MTEKRCTCGEQTLCMCPVHRPSDTPTVRDAADHRHAKDILGHSLYIGDQVVAMVRLSSGSSSHNHYLVLAIVQAILPKTLRVTYPHPAPWRGPPTPQESLVPDNRLVKVTARRHKLGTHAGTDVPQVTPVDPGPTRANTGPVGVK